MFRSCHNFKILDPVVSFIMVYMMDTFLWREVSSKMIGHNNSMFGDIILISTPCSHRMAGHEKMGISTHNDLASFPSVSFFFGKEFTFAPSRAESSPGVAKNHFLFTLWTQKYFVFKAKFSVVPSYFMRFIKDTANIFAFNFPVIGNIFKFHGDMIAQ